MNIFNLKSYADDQNQTEEAEPEEVQDADGTDDVSIWLWAVHRPATPF